jgi:hypothetical protein
LSAGVVLDVDLSLVRHLAARTLVALAEHRSLQVLSLATLEVQSALLVGQLRRRESRQLRRTEVARGNARTQRGIVLVLETEEQRPQAVLVQLAGECLAARAARLGMQLEDARLEDGGIGGGSLCCGSLVAR